MESKRKNVYITIFIITTVLAGCLAVYFGVKGNKDVEKLEAKLKENTALTDDTTKEQEEKNNEQTEKNNTEVVEKVVEKIVEKGIIPTYDPSKMQNKLSDVNYSNNIMYSQIVSGLSFNINSSGNVNATVHNGGESKELKINGINGKVIDVCQGTLGQGANDALVFLTENGDVYFADNVLAATNQYNGTWVLNAEKVSSVSNICRIFWSMSEKTNSNSKARATFIAIDTNGNCYDLWFECKGK